MFVYYLTPLPFPSWLLGRRPEFVDPKIVAQGEGRESKCIKVLFRKFFSCDDFHFMFLSSHKSAVSRSCHGLCECGYQRLVEAGI